MTVGAIGDERGPQRRLEVVVSLDADASRPAGAGDRREIDRAELRGDADPRPAAFLPHPDRAIALVVEDDDDDPGADPDGGLELRHRHREAAVADQRDDRTIAMDERGRDGRREAVAHGARRRTEERPRPPEPEAAADPAREIAGVGRQDAVVGEDPAERGDRSGRDGRRGRPTASSSTIEAASHAARSSRLAAWRVATRAASRTARPSSRSLAALRNALASARPTRVGGGRAGQPPGARSTWAHGRPGRGIV